MSSPCCTGFGAGDSHAKILNDGRENTHPDAGQPYQTITPDQLSGMISDPPQILDKAHGQWIIPSTYNAYDGRSHNAQRENGSFPWLAADIDKGSPDLPQVLEAVRATLGPDIWCGIYSTASSTSEVRKWRVFIPLLEPMTGIEYGAYEAAWFDALEACGLILDRALERPGQIIYLPAKTATTVYESILDGTQLFDAKNHPVAQRAAAYMQAYEEAYAGLRDQVSNEGVRSHLRAFRLTHSIDELLSLYGFECSPSHPDLWRHPDQASSSFGSMRIMRYPDGDRWVSRSDTINAMGFGRSTPSGSRMGDAFDLYVHFNCQGNQAVAEAYAKTLVAKLDDERYGAATVEHGEQIYLTLWCCGAPVGPDAHAVALQEAQARVEELKVEVPEDVPAGEWDIDFPVGTLGEVAKTIYNTSARPVRQYAIGAALHMAAGIFGSRFNVEGFGLNLHMMIVGNSGTGKGEARRTEERIYTEVGKQVQDAQGIIEVFGHAAPASAEGMRQMFEGDYESRATYTEDADAQLDMLMTAQAGSNGDRLRSAETQYWDNSGQGRILGSVSYSKKENKIDALISPALTIGRDFQLDGLRAYLGARTTSRGHGPRQIFIIYEGNKVRPIRGRDKSLPKWLIDVLASHWQRVRSINGDAVVNVTVAKETTELFHALEDTQLDRQDAGGDAYEILNRVHMNAMRVAGLVAVMENVQTPTITPEMFKWASEFVLLGANRAIKMMTTGDVGSGEAVRVNRAVKAIVDYVKMPAGRRQGTYRVAKSLAGLDYVIGENYLMRKLKQSPDFKGSDTGYTSEDLIRRTIKELVLQEYLEEADAATVQERENVILDRRTTQKLYFVGPAVGLK